MARHPEDRDAEPDAPRPRRLNRLPLAVAAAVVAAVLLALIYAASQRGARQSGGEETAEPETAAAAPSRPAARPEALISGYAGEGEIPARRPEPPPESAAPPPAQPAPPALSPAELAAIEEAAEIRRERQARREQLLRDALSAPTSVAAGSPASPPPAAAGADSGAGMDRLLDRLPALAAGGAPREDRDDPNLRARKTAFAGESRRFGYSPESRLPALGRHELKAGTAIPALLAGGIDSDLPGMVLAQVSRPVLDTRTGSAVLIPAGARLVGAYDHHVALGQRRVMVSWHRLQFPDGSTLHLGGMPGTDQAGYAGYRDRVDNHYGRAFGAAALLSVIGAGAQLSQRDERTDQRIAPGQAAAGEAGRQWGEVGREIARRNLRIQPTLRIRPGYRFHVLVTQDLILDPYGAPRSQGRAPRPLAARSFIGNPMGERQHRSAAAAWSMDTDGTSRGDGAQPRNGGNRDIADFPRATRGPH